jgi:hypothetical protein
MKHYEDLVERLRNGTKLPLLQALMNEAADAIEDLSAYLANIDSLSSCNTCMKKGCCEFAPRPGQYCRINCPAWLGEVETKS